MKKNVKKMDELLNSSELDRNFYVEELEDRLEMTAATASADIENKACWVWVFE